ncbi:transposase [Streptomyces sparsogenes]|uniref:transposase n=1 Tax=Streptomyces sparsogenes TaxID=67365 RepID=UPI00384E7473
MIPKGSGEMVAATIRTIFIQPPPKPPITSLMRWPTCLSSSPPKSHRCSWMPRRTRPPSASPTKRRSSPPLERINREIKRRTNVVQVFPNPATLERLVTVVLSEHDEWIAFPRCYLSEGSMTAIYAAEHADQTTHALFKAPNASDD